METLLAFTVILLTTAGQILLKKGAVPNTTKHLNIYILSGYFLFTVTVIISYYLMRIIPMIYFTVIMSINYLAVLFAANIFLNEKLNRYKFIGTLLISLGILIFIGGNKF